MALRKTGWKGWVTAQSSGSGLQTPHLSEPRAYSLSLCALWTPWESSGRHPLGMKWYHVLPGTHCQHTGCRWGLVHSPRLCANAHCPPRKTTKTLKEGGDTSGLQNRESSLLSVSGLHDASCMPASHSLWLTTVPIPSPLHYMKSQPSPQSWSCVLLSPARTQRGR